MLHDKMRFVRMQKGVTQDEIASYLKIKRQTYSAYERGISIPDALTLKKIAIFMNVTTDYLLDNESDINEFKFALYNEVEELDEDAKEDVLNFAKYMRQKRESEHKK